MFELLKKVIPGVKRVGLLGDRDVRGFIGAMEEAAHSLGIATQQFRVTSPSPDLEGAFEAFKQWHADAVVVMEEPVVSTNRQRIAALALRERPADLPVEFVNTYELIVNLKTARDMGVTVPADVVERANRVIR